MKNLFMAVATLLMVCSSCSATSPRSKQLTVKGKFDGISVANNIEVVYTPASNVSISVKASDKGMSCLKMEVKNGTLHFKAPDARNEEIKITMTAPDLKSITAVNNAEVKVTKTLTVSSAKITATNNGEIELNGGINANDVSISATNNGEISLPSLYAVKAAISTTNNAELKCKKVEVTDIKCTATNNSEIDIAGHGVTVNFTATNNAEIDAADFQAGSGKATATNLATIKANVDNLTTSTTNMAKIYNK
ncbi:MAG: hypothetical protein HFJ87_05940 [Muribaculaceae bacterium]|nr:hypothetical protein [Muribaculaceae bacterium]